MKYAWIKKNSKDFNIYQMCKILKVDKSSYYHWIKSGCKDKQIDEKLNELIEIVFVQGRQNYGTIMKYLGLVAKTKKNIKSIQQTLTIIYQLLQIF